MTHKKYFFPALLAGIFVILIYISLPKGYFWGSHTDWLSQHVRLAESIRNACIEQKTLVPDLLPLGGWSNGYQFSYYGYLRPDILIGILFPSVPMVYFVIGYMLVGYFCSVMLCYYWLWDHTKNKASAFMGSLLFLTAACFFQTHRQIMFINYMPFLLLALLCIRKKRYQFLPLCMLLIYLNSFYYSIACLAVIGWYWLRQDMKGFWKKGFICYIKSTFLSIGMAALLLIPTALVILEHRRPSEKISLLELFGSNADLHSLLYSPYGMGLTAVCLYLLLLGVLHKAYKLDSAMLLFISLCSAAAWILNGTLYARAKILVPFVPLIILQCGRLLNDLRQKNIEWKLWPCFFILPFIYLKRTQNSFIWFALDAGVVMFIVLLNKLKCRNSLQSTRHVLSWILLCIMPCLLFYETMQKEDFVKKEKVFQAQPALEAGNLENDPLYRYDSLTNPLITANLVSKNNMQKTGMYSSIYSEKYSNFYYDTLLTPVQINNRLAILPAANPFMLNFLGVRYVETTPDNVPWGYDIIGTAGSTDTTSSANTGGPASTENPPNAADKDKEPSPVLAENKNVLPIAYVTDSAISESEFLALDTYNRLDTVMRSTIVPDAENKNTASPKGSPAREDSVMADSGVKKYNPVFTSDSLPDTISYERTQDGLLLDVKKKSTFSLKLQQPLREQILMLSFDIENKGSSSIVIDINGIRNKLSSPTAPYPNQNSIFHYQFSQKDEIDALSITLSKGKYSLKDIQWYTYDSRLLSQKQYTPLKNVTAGKQTDSSKNELISGQAVAEKDSYFVTSIPVQKGMEVWINGKEAPLLTVNQAFVGAKLPKGTYDISVRFQVPGKKAGMILTLASFFVYFLYLVCPRLKACTRRKKSY